MDSTGQKEDEDTVEETCMKNQSEDRRKNNIRELRNCRKWLNKKKKKIVLITKSLDFCFFFYFSFCIIWNFNYNNDSKWRKERERKKQGNAHNAVLWLRQVSVRLCTPINPCAPATFGSANSQVVSQSVIYSVIQSVGQRFDAVCVCVQVCECLLLSLKVKLFTLKMLIKLHFNFRCRRCFPIRLLLDFVHLSEGCG